MKRLERNQNLDAKLFSMHFNASFIFTSNVDVCSLRTLVPQMNTDSNMCVNSIYTTHMNESLPSLCSAGRSVHNLWSANITMLSRQIPAVYKHFIIVSTNPHVRFV
jgi:hypothetical protein